MSTVVEGLRRSVRIQEKLASQNKTLSDENRGPNVSANNVSARKGTPRVGDVSSQRKKVNVGTNTQDILEGVKKLSLQESQQKHTKSKTLKFKGLDTILEGNEQGSTVEGAQRKVSKSRKSIPLQDVSNEGKKKIPRSTSLKDASAVKKTAKALLNACGGTLEPSFTQFEQQLFSDNATQSTPITSLETSSGYNTSMQLGLSHRRNRRSSMVPLEVAHKGSRGTRKHKAD
ncbi:uncharacterized protein LOC135384177 [Ornithodoros turicata]|uniref:uncharacterized protein LOC135384177 n=1 Tax=Ornithodoros turicata TaxID=34597 RepID=UPI0031390B32